MSRNSLEIKLQAAHPAQQQILNEARRFNIACMGRRFGKSALGIRLLSETALQKRPAAWFAPTYKLLDEAWREARRRLSPVITRQDTQQHRMEIMTGGSLDFWSLDNPDAGRSRKYARVIIDEAAMARNLEEAWTQAIRPTLADLAGDAWFFSTPKGGNFFKTLYDRAGNDPEWMRWQMPTSSNPYIAVSEIEAMRRDLPSIVFDQEVLAQFVDMAGAAVKREWLRYLPCPPSLPVTLGVDLALSTKQDADYTAIVAISRDSSGMIYIRDAQRIQAGFHTVLQFIRQMAEKHSAVTIGIEQVQYQAAVVQELLRTTALPVQGIRPDKDKLTRFMPLLARYEQGLVAHVPGLLPEFEDELLSFPVGEHDDFCDAAAYALQSIPPEAVPDYSLGGMSRAFEVA